MNEIHALNAQFSAFSSQLAFSFQLRMELLGWTLLHFLWQGTAIAFLYTLIRFFGRSWSPQKRYALACLTLLAMAIAPPLTYLTLSSGAGTPSEFRWSLSIAAWKWLPGATVSFWVAGVFAFSIRLLRAFLFTRRLRVTSHPAPPEWQQTLQRIAVAIGQSRMVRSARLMASPLVNTPAIIGWMQPLILIPATALTGLPADYIVALLTHEMAHVRRNDYIAGVLQSFVEVVLFYHPAIWWISGQIRMERELCCDDLVIATGTDTITYARALTELELRRPLRLKLQLAADGGASPDAGSLTERIRRLIDPTHIRAHCLPRAESAFAMILLWCAGAGVLAHAGAREPIPARFAASSSSVQPTAATNSVTTPLPGQLLSNPLVSNAAASNSAVSNPPVSNPVATLSGHARNTLLFDPVLTAQLLPAQASQTKPSAASAPLKAETPPADLKMAVEVNYFRLNNAESFVPVSLFLGGDVLAQARKSGATRTQIDITTEIKDEIDTLVQNTSDQMDIGVSYATLAELSKRSIEYQTGGKLLPGKYSIKVMAHDSTTNRTGTYSGKFSIPNLSKVEQAVPITSVVLGNERELPVTSGVPAYRHSPNPLFEDGQEIVPNVKRVFSSKGDMVVYLQAFEKGAATTQPLTAHVTFLRGSAKVMETRSVNVTEGLDPKSKMVPIRMNVPLAQLKPGQYICRVTVLDPATQKTATWQSSVTMTP
jgi:beta-lactamase regulating signal transducer with metallopeptidase domain